MNPRHTHPGGRVQMALPESDLLTAREVAHRLRVDETTVRRWIKGGVLDAIALPHASTRTGYRIKKTTLEALLQAPPFPKQQRGTRR